jgi:wobble nucleotide-excising tRNase
VKLDEANNEVDKFCIQQAKFIKNLLSSSGGQNPYNTYNKGTFRDACKRIGSSAQAIRALLTTEQKSTFTAKKEGQPKSSLSLVAFTFPDLKKSRDMAVELLRETVVSTAINDLVNNPELGSWVETGLALHSKEHKRTHCGFCGTSLPENRLYELEAHFNDTYKQFTAKLDKAVRDLHIQKRSLELLVVPDKSQIYEHLAERISAASQKLSTFSIEVRNYLDALAQSLEQKRDRVFEACKLEPSVVEPDCSIANPWISEINELIRQHNRQTISKVLSGMQERDWRNTTSLKHTRSFLQRRKLPSSSALNFECLSPPRYPSRQKLRDSKRQSSNTGSQPKSSTRSLQAIWVETICSWR